MKQASRDTSFEGSYGQTNTGDKVKLAQDDKEGGFCWNGKTNEFMGRTFWSWLKLLGYSFFFIGGLVLFWGLCLWVFYQTLDNYTPKLQTSSSFIGANPGLGYRPMRQVQCRG